MSGDVVMLGQDLGTSWGTIAVAIAAAFILVVREVQRYRDRVRIQKQFEAQQVGEQSAQARLSASDWKERWDAAMAKIGDLRKEIEERIAATKELELRLVFKDERMKELEKKANDTTQYNANLQGQLDVLIRRLREIDVKMTLNNPP